VRRIEAIPYYSLDEQMELAIDLAKQKREKAIKAVHDLGNCFLIELFTPDKNIRW
jgi:hypothetical protein